MARWRGRAFGADLWIEVVDMPAAQRRRLWKDVKREIGRIATQVSLYQPSELRRLNETGILRNPTPDMLELFEWADRLHRATNGVFDPTVQVLWQAYEAGGDVVAAREKTGWHKVAFSRERIRLRPGMSLTFNGIAQGYAADRIATLLQSSGIEDAFVDMGEIHALGCAADGRLWEVGIARANGALVATLPLSNRGLATSSPGATRVGRQKAYHIMHPQGRHPKWDTVAVSAREAVLADGLATAFCLMDREEIAACLSRLNDVQIAFLG
ncbi:FAD:protein FMN transferase [Shimia sp. FJ5]|uniref:FAD:protein FMN transferase n=1 Tax=Shimia sp. FJ5 TaxID=3079054 RepID=UPI00260D167A|nr:FAD:protein FMN transferase [Shimia sp. FJ5]MDV4146109.1 FAD:protein FMN transferase [Shimia sp. FJ5]